MRHIPTIYPAVIFSIIFAGTHATCVTVVEWCYPVAFLIFRVEKACFFVEEIPVVVRTLQVMGGFVFLAQYFGDAGKAPLVVARSQCNGNRLALLERMHVRVGFLFIRAKSRDISIFPVEIVQPAGCCSRPGSERFLFNSFPAGFVGFGRVYIQSFSESVGYGSNGMIGIHTA